MEMRQSKRKTAMELVDMYYLDVRSGLLEAAAALDRIERAPGGEEAMNDPRVRQLLDIGAILRDQKENRAEAVLLRLSESAS